jgi:nucleoside-diphosphate-sugar epimerase
MTKAAATLYCQNAAKKHGLPIVIMRPFAVYGPFEEQTRLIPTLVGAYINGQSPKLSSPDSVRDFVFVEDVVAAYMAAIKNIEKTKGEIFNVGSGIQYTIGEIAAMVQEMTGSKLLPEYGQIKQVQEEPIRWVADISKAKTLLGWEPAHTIQQGLKKLIAL